MPSHGYVASASVTIPPLAAVWLRLEPELDEEQAIEPGEGHPRRHRGGKAASTCHDGNGALTGPAPASACQASRIGDCRGW